MRYKLFQTLIKKNYLTSHLVDSGNCHQLEIYTKRNKHNKPIYDSVHQRFNNMLQTKVAIINMSTERSFNILNGNKINDDALQLIIEFSRTPISERFELKTEYTIRMTEFQIDTLTQYREINKNNPENKTITSVISSLLTQISNSNKQFALDHEQDVDEPSTTLNESTVNDTYKDPVDTITDDFDEPEDATSDNDINPSLSDQTSQRTWEDEDAIIPKSDDDNIDTSEAYSPLEPLPNDINDNLFTNEPSQSNENLETPNTDPVNDTSSNKTADKLQTHSDINDSIESNTDKLFNRNDETLAPDDDWITNQDDIDDSKDENMDNPFIDHPTKKRH